MLLYFVRILLHLAKRISRNIIQLPYFKITLPLLDMEFVRDIFKSYKTHQVVILALLVVYILSGTKTPQPVGAMIDSTLGNLVVLAMALFSLYHGHPVIGLVGLYAAYELIMRSSGGSNTIKKFLPSQSKTDDTMDAMNDFPLTLEEEQVASMAPLVGPGASSSLDYKPNDDEVHNALSM